MKTAFYLVFIISMLAACRTRKINKHETLKDSTVTTAFDSGYKKTKEKQSSSEEHTQYDNSEKIYFNKNAIITIEPNGNTIYSGVDSAIIHNKTKTHKKQEEKKAVSDSGAISKKKDVEVVEKQKDKTIAAKPSFQWMYIAAFAMLVIALAAVIYFKRNVIVKKFKSLLKLIK